MARLSPPPLLQSPSHSLGVGWIIFKRFGVVEHHLRTPHAGDEIERYQRRLAREIGDNAEPLEERWAISLKAGGQQSIRQTLPLEIDGSEGERVGYGKICLLQTLALPVL